MNPNHPSFDPSFIRTKKPKSGKKVEMDPDQIARANKMNPGHVDYDPKFLE